MHLTENQLQTYFDGEMPAPERERTAHHLQTCPDCQTALQQIESRVGRVESLLTHLDPTSCLDHHLRPAGELHICVVGEFADVTHEPEADGRGRIDFFQPVAAS